MPISVMEIRQHLKKQVMQIREYLPVFLSCVAFTDAQDSDESMEYFNAVFILNCLIQEVKGIAYQSTAVI